MSDLDKFKFEAITPESSKYYRVSWYGSISYSDGNKNRPTPIIEVFMDELKAEPSSERRVLPSDISKGTTIKVRLPVSLLGVVRLGDIWNNGQLYQSAENHHSVNQFRNINITDNSHTKIRANHKLGEDRYLLPLFIHPYHLNFTKSWCEKVRLDDNRSLIIPHIVMIQTFFAPDTFILEQAFQNGLTLDTICNQKKSHHNQQTGKVFVQLRRQVLDSSHITCASILFDENFRESYKTVSKSLSSQKADGSKILTPKITMPVEGKQTLSAVGQWIKYPDDSWAFLVLQILSSSYTPPFTEVTYFRDAPGDRNSDAKPPDNNPGGKQSGGKNRTEPKPDRDPLNVDPNKDPSGDYEPVTATLNSYSRFPNFIKVPSKKERQEDHKNDEINPRNPSSKEVGEAGAGGKGNDDGPGFTGENDDSEPLKETSKPTFEQRFNRVTLFMSVLQELTSLRVEEAQVFYVERQELFEFPKVKLNNRDSTWDNVNYNRGDNVIQKKRYIPRKVLASKVRLASGIIYYLFEAERKMKLAANGWYEVDSLSLLAIRENELTMRSIKSLLKSTTQNSGWPKIEPPARGLLIRHSDSPAIVDSSMDKSIYSKHMAEHIYKKISDFETKITKKNRAD